MNTGSAGLPGSAAWASRAARSLATRSSTEVPSTAAGSSAGTVSARDRSRHRPAYTPPSSGSTRESTMASPRRSDRNTPRETSSAAIGGVSCSAARRSAASVPMRDSTSAASAGTPMIVRLGIACRLPRLRTCELCRVEGNTESSPSSAARFFVSGRRLRLASAPVSMPTGTAPSSVVDFRQPPRRSPASRTVTSWSAERRWAATRPETPPPTTVI